MNVLDWAVRVLGIWFALSLFTVGVFALIRGVSPSAATPRPEPPAGRGNPGTFRRLPSAARDDRQPPPTHGPGAVGATSTWIERPAARHAVAFLAAANRGTPPPYDQLAADPDVSTADLIDALCEITRDVWRASDPLPLDVWAEVAALEIDWRVEP